MLQEVHGDIRERFLDAFGAAGFQRSPALSLLQPTIKTSFLFSVGFVDVLDAVAGKSVHQQSPRVKQSPRVRSSFIANWAFNLCSFAFVSLQ
jgi:hypothetical protein